MKQAKMRIMGLIRRIPVWLKPRKSVPFDYQLPDDLDKEVLYIRHNNSIVSLLASNAIDLAISRDPTDKLLKLMRDLKILKTKHPDIYIEFIERALILYDKDRVFKLCQRAQKLLYNEIVYFPEEAENRQLSFINTFNCSKGNLIDSQSLIISQDENALVTKLAVP